MASAISASARLASEFRVKHRRTKAATLANMFDADPFGAEISS
jgi:hypothetical protein